MEGREYLLFTPLLQFIVSSSSNIIIIIIIIIINDNVNVITHNYFIIRKTEK